MKRQLPLGKTPKPEMEKAFPNVNQTAMNN